MTIQPITDTGSSGIMPNSTEIASHFHLVSWTKDSILVRWSIDEGQRPFITGYKITYQAIGSKVKQLIELNAGIMEYDITKLHENTNYDLCMHVSTNLSSSIPRECIKATTATDSLSVALGSTFGAFLALGIIVLFVFMAKWQHNRKLKKQLQHMTPSAEESFDSVAQQDGEIEMSDVSLQVHDDGKWDFSSHSSSQFSSMANGGAAAANRRQSNHVDCGSLPPLHKPVEPSTSSSGVTSEPSTSSGQTALAQDGLLKPPLPPGVIPVQPTEPSPDVRPKDVRPKDVRPKDVRPKDVRPKERPLLDLTNAYQNAQYPDPAEVVSIRPNLSCKW